MRSYPYMPPRYSGWPNRQFTNAEPYTEEQRAARAERQANCPHERIYDGTTMNLCYECGKIWGKDGEEE